MTREDSELVNMVKLLNDGGLIVLRYEGPKGGPGMREMLAPEAFVGGIIGLVHEGCIDKFGSPSMRLSC